MSDPRPLGDPVAGWAEPARPGPAVIEGRHVRLERLDPGRHAGALHAAFAGQDWLWDYMPYGPFASAGAYHAWASAAAIADDPLFYVLCDPASGACGGVASLMRITPAAGSIEVGGICIAPVLQRAPAVTEAMFLLMRWAFAAGYRRYEWKCDALNLPSRRAALRLGFAFEGIFRQHLVIKGRNRDTAWFSVIDGEWPALKAAFEAWLAPENFDDQGRQRRRLSDLTAPLRGA